MPYEKILADPRYRNLLSDEGEVTVTRYDKPVQ
jgi:hypothetical protein